MATEIQVLSVLSNGHNGHYAVNLRVVESTPDGEKLGPVETHGIDATALSRLYGDVDLDTAIGLWLVGVKSKMENNYSTHGKVSAALGAMVGKRLKIG